MQGGCNKIEPSEESETGAAPVVKMENNQPSLNAGVSSDMAVKYSKFGSKRRPINLDEDEAPVLGPVEDKKASDPVDEKMESKTGGAMESKTGGAGESAAVRRFGGGGRWVFYAKLISTANISPETMEKIPNLHEFIYDRRNSDGAIMVYVQFKRGLTIRVDWFLEQMSALGIRVDPSSIQPPKNQAEYPMTKGKVALGGRVDFHWCCKALQRTMERQAAERKQVAAEKKQVAEEESSGDERPTPTGKKTRAEGSKESPAQKAKGVRDFKDMTLGEIIGIIEKQDVVISNQRESIRRMTEGGSICQVTEGGGDDAPKLAQLAADNSALESDNAELVAVNKKLKAELREIKRANEGFYEQNKKLKKQLAIAGNEMPEGPP